MNAPLTRRIAKGLEWRFRVLQERVTGVINRVLPHDLVYDDEYFASIDQDSSASAPGIVAHLVDKFGPQSVLDVGCGTGAILAEFGKTGIVRLHGLEYAEAALAYCRTRQLDVHKFDLEANADAALPSSLDLVISLEVAEHLPAAIASKFVALLAKPRAPVVLTAAPPGQGGTDHVNEQPKEYWVALFKSQEMDLDTETTQALASGWKLSGVTWWYHQNVMVFRPRLAVESIDA